MCWKSALEEDSSDAGRRAPVGPIAAFLATIVKPGTDRSKEKQMCVKVDIEHFI